MNVKTSKWGEGPHTYSNVLCSIVVLLLFACMLCMYIFIYIYKYTVCVFMRVYIYITIQSRSTPSFLPPQQVVHRMEANPSDQDLQQKVRVVAGG